MKALILTSMQPSFGQEHRVGIAHRFQVFLDAISQVSDAVRVVHIVPPEMVAAQGGGAALSRQQSDYWGRPVAVSLIGRRARGESVLDHYGRGVVRAAEQPPFASFAGPEQAAAVARVLAEARPDLLFVHRMQAMCALLRAGRGAVRQAGRMFFDLDDVEHRVQVRSVLAPPLWPGKLAYLSHIPALVGAEWRGAALSAGTFVCSERDRAHLARLGMRRVSVVPNALAMPAEAPGVSAAPVLLFVGAYEYPPNAEAAARLLTRIFPLVRRAVPGARLLLAGKGGAALPVVQAGVPEGVEVLGFVPDLAALYAGARVVVCPLVNGGGTRLKLIEAAGYARPMVSTQMGAEGLDFAEGREVVVRDDDEGFAEACVALLRDDAACARLGAAARARALAEYEAGRVVARVRGVLERGLG
jgi:glycosyltransferase involved in cell wall biosynthesis